MKEIFTKSIVFLKSITALLLVSQGGKAFAQAPGGISTGLVSWNKQNIGNTGTVWKNNVGANDAAGTGTIVYNSTTDLVNFNRSYTFNTSGIFTLPAALDLSGSYSVFGVSTLKTIGVNGRVFGSALSNVLLGYWTNRMNTVFYDGTPNSLVTGVNGVIDSKRDLTQYTYIRSAGPFSFSGNGSTILSGAASGAIAFRGTIGGSSGENSNVVVPEYITYNTALSNADKNKVESYLALKYGYTKSGDYINSAGGTYWTSGTGYDKNVAGIGRDDASALEQKVSKSQNTDATLTLSTNSDFSLPNEDAGRVTISGNLGFLMIGNDNASANTRQATDVAPGFNTRISREWRIQNTNFTQNVGLKFSSIDIYPSAWNLIWDADGNFTSGAVNLGLLSASASSEGMFTGSQLASGYLALMTNTTDSDGDGITDIINDLDADNDGIPDAIECPKQFYWTGPITISGATASGVVNGVPYTYVSDKLIGATAGVVGHSTFPASYGVPNNNPTIQNTQVSHNVLTFAEPMPNPLFVFASVGNAGLAVPVVFDRPVQIVWSTGVVVNSPTQFTGTEGFAIVKIPGVHTAISFDYTAPEFYANFTFGAEQFQNCDFDNDGVDNYLDLDSDNDGCLDAIEGDENATIGQLSVSGGTVGVGTGSWAPKKNLCPNFSCIDAQGVPILVNTGGAADIGNDQGQGLGSSQNGAVRPSGCNTCSKPPVTGIGLDTQYGITSLGRAGSAGDNWPMVRKGAWTALESKTKGFVVNRLTTAEINLIPAANLVEGMMVYDTTLNCLKVYTTTDNGTTYGWNCMNTQTCP
ncbi:thrombospondin type 3 repeat-containing protein [Chryseobacterium aurantiacum]|uniref:thrombospondin type 3 repeat-containing protein n=1 Tax=Chryseobacterium aurantiacum TaxID=2116499 RepID=UPI000D115D15|nr:thrombospondin type 3 repeat-containing protein [Chryseobacterium aurantiacum]